MQSKKLTSNTHQPAVIPVFFATEMWERFGFYMIQSLLILYMTSAIFDFSDSKSYSILGAFSAIAYITPILGGYVASRVLDYEHAITLGGFLLAIGYALLSLPYEGFFYIALAVISIGNGFFKPNISSYLGDFYRKNDPYREKGYTIFYVGINLGILLSTSTSGYIVRYFGWHVPFIFASIGLLIGTATFVFGIYYLKNTNNFHRLNPSIAHKNPLAVIMVYLGAIVMTFLSYQIIKHRAIADQLMLWGGCALFAGIIIYAFRYKTDVRNKLIACVMLTLISIVFWAIYMQMFFSVNLFIQRAVDRQFFSMHLPTPLFLSLESIYIVILGPFFAMLWHTLSRKKKNISIPMKFTLAMFSTAITFFIAYWGTRDINLSGMTSMWFIVVAYLFLTIGELLLSPVGLAMVTVLVPRELIGLMMGLWFVALGLGEKLAGVIAGYAAIPKDIQLMSKMDLIYGDAFFHYAALSLVVGVLCLLATPILKKMIGQE